jgi:hypothetical protein
MLSLREMVAFPSRETIRENEKQAKRTFIGTGTFVYCSLYFLFLPPFCLGRS